MVDKRYVPPGASTRPTSLRTWTASSTKTSEWQCQTTSNEASLNTERSFMLPRTSRILTRCRVADRLELGRRDVEDRRLGTELGEDDGIPTAPRRQAEDAGTVQLHAFQARARIQEAAHAGLGLGGPAERP